MKIITNECVDCPKELGCICEACPYYQVERYYCDECGEETMLYEYDNFTELCADCILKKYPKIEGSDI